MTVSSKDFIIQSTCLQAFSGILKGKVAIRKQIRSWSRRLLKENCFGENSFQMKAIILAAGMGTRFDKYTKDLPKCMLNFNGKTLIERQVETLRACGINRSEEH